MDGVRSGRPREETDSHKVGFRTREGKGRLAILEARMRCLSKRRGWKRNGESFGLPQDQEMSSWTLAAICRATLSHIPCGHCQFVDGNRRGTGEKEENPGGGVSRSCLRGRLAYTSRKAREVRVRLPIVACGGLRAAVAELRGTELLDDDLRLRVYTSIEGGGRNGGLVLEQLSCAIVARGGGSLC